MSGTVQYFYLVNSIGTGVYPDAIRPDIPAGTPWAGQMVPGTNQWIIRSPRTSIPGYNRYTEAQARNYAENHGFDYDEIVSSWYAN